MVTWRLGKPGLAAIGIAIGMLGAIGILGNLEAGASLAWQLRNRYRNTWSYRNPW